MHILHIQYRTTRHNIVYDDHDGSIEVTGYLRTSVYVYRQVELVLFVRRRVFFYFIILLLYYFTYTNNV